MNFHQEQKNTNKQEYREIQQAVEKSLTRAPGVPSGRIDVVVDHGFVVLRGSVPNRHMKSEARKAAAQPEVGRGIVSQIRIEPDAAYSDARIADAVREALNEHRKVIKSTIAVTVHDGRVTLTGTAGHDFQRILAEDAALSVEGVRRVKNLILVDMDEQVRNRELSSRIEEGLAYIPGVDEDKIHVAVSGSSAVLSGTVGTPEQKERAERAVRKYPPMNIRNDIRVEAEEMSA